MNQQKKKKEKKIEQTDNEKEIESVKIPQHRKAKDQILKKELKPFLHTFPKKKLKRRE